MTDKRSSSFRSSALRIAFAILPTIGVLLALELLVRGGYAVRRAAIEIVTLPYAAGHGYGPIPPWTDGLRILEKDPALIWRGRRSVRRTYMDVFSPAWEPKDRSRLLHQFLPRLPESLAENPIWEVALNSEGFRERELPQRPAAGAVRIVCLGDSWTFGANVGLKDSYPDQLARVLRDTYPQTPFEVLNLGVLGYSSYQGLGVLRTRALALEPGVVVIGFAMNDGAVSGWRDRDMAATEEEPPPMRKRTIRLLKRSELLRLLRYIVALAAWEPRSITDRLLEVGEVGENEPIDWEAMEPWIRVALPEYRRNIQEMIELARGAGADVVLLYNEFETEGRYLLALRDVAAASGAPLVDSSALLAAERRRVEAGRAQALGLRPAGLFPGPAGGVDVVFRVRPGSRETHHGIFLAGNHPALANGEPNVLAMHDDGTHGDERAGDGVWSRRARLEPGSRTAYVYTNGGIAGKWLGLDVPAIRRASIAPDAIGHTLYRPIEIFGEITLHADSWHTNATGYNMIAEAILEALRGESGFRRRVDSQKSGPEIGTLPTSHRSDSAPNPGRPREDSSPHPSA